MVPSLVSETRNPLATSAFDGFIDDVPNVSSSNSSHLTVLMLSLTLRFKGSGSVRGDGQVERPTLLCYGSLEGPATLERVFSGIALHQTPRTDASPYRPNYWRLHFWEFWDLVHQSLVFYFSAKLELCGLHFIARAVFNRIRYLVK